MERGPLAFDGSRNGQLLLTTSLVAAARERGRTARAADSKAQSSCTSVLALPATTETPEPAQSKALATIVGRARRLGRKLTVKGTSVSWQSDDDDFKAKSASVARSNSTLRPFATATTGPEFPHKATRVKPVTSTTPPLGGVSAPGALEELRVTKWTPLRSARATGPTAELARPGVPASTAKRAARRDNVPASIATRDFGPNFILP